MIEQQKDKREVTRVFTPGTFCDNPLDDNDYHIACVHVVNDTLQNTAVLDVSTGEMDLIELTKNKHDFEWFLQAYNVYEIIILSEDDHSLCVPETITTYKRKPCLQYFNKLYHKDILGDYESLIEIQYKPVVSILFEFLKSCGTNVLQKIHLPKNLHLNTMSLYHNALYQLDIYPTKNGTGVCSIIDFTKTKMGSRKLRRLLSAPYTDIKTLQEISRNVDNIVPDVHEISKLLETLPDMERLRVKMVNGQVSLDLIENLVSCCTTCTVYHLITMYWNLPKQCVIFFKHFTRITNFLPDVSPHLLYIKIIIINFETR